MAIRIANEIRPLPAIDARVRNIDVIIAGLHINASADLRRLSQRGYSVLGLTEDSEEEGLYSRYGMKMLCPHPLDEFEDWVAWMQTLGRFNRRRPALIPTSDLHVLALDRAAKRLHHHFRFIGFGSGLRTALTRKQRTFALAARHKFPIPVTRFVGSRGDLAGVLEGFPFPAVVKPEFSPEWHTKGALDALGFVKAMRANNSDEVAQIYERVRQFSPGVIVQELIPGPDTNLIYWAGFVGPDSTVRGRFVGRKTRVNPVHYGSGSFVELVEMPDVEYQCESFLRTIGYRGRCGIELKIDERDGMAKLIEVNPRTGLWEDIGLSAGVDLASEEVETLFGGDPPAKRARSGARWVHLGRDLEAFKQYHQEGTLGWLKWMRSLRPPIKIADMPFLSDFPYAWKNTRKILKDLAGYLRRRL